MKNRLSSTKLKFYRFSLPEIQSNNIELISIEKSKSAYSISKAPVLIEDDGLFIKSLNGFPGPYSSFIYDTIGNNGVLKLMKGKKDRKAWFKSIFVYNDGTLIKLFDGEINGKISSRMSDGGWGFDPIFIPEKSRMSMGKLHKKAEKNKYSHRGMALEKFIDWYNNIR